MKLLNNAAVMVDGYSIEVYPQQNLITITLPQTFETLTNTVTPIRQRKRTLSPSELMTVLLTVKNMLENENEID